MHLGKLQVSPVDWRVPSSVPSPLQVLQGQLRGASPELAQAEHGPGCMPLNLSGGLGELLGLAHTSAGHPSPPRKPRALWILTTLLVDKTLPL